MPPPPLTAAARAAICGLVAVAILAPSAGRAQPTPAPAVPPTVVVQGVDAAVEVITSPLRLAVLDAAGREVLASVVDAPPATPTVQLPLPPEIIGFDLPLQDPPTYAPITYVVGIDRPLQQPAGTWVTNILLSASGGIEHALTEVTAITERRDGGVDLQVATTEPGRTAQVAVAPDADGLVAVEVSFDDPTGIATVAASFATDDDEAFHGFGGRRDEVDQRGSSFTNWHEEFHQRPGVTEVEPLETLGPRYQFPSGPEAAYYAIGAFVSSRPYAFWLETTTPSRWRMASDRPDAWQVAAAGDRLRMVIAPGDAPTAVANLTAQTGRHPLPPEWALGPMVSRAVQAGGQAAAYAADVDADLSAIESLRPPLTAYAFEGWPWVEEQGRLSATVDRVRDLDLRAVGYVRAFAGADGGGTERTAVFGEALAGGYLATAPGGAPYLFGSALGPGPAGLVDATDEGAASWWRARITDHLDDGFDGFMQDFGEQAFVDMQFADGRTGLEVHNDHPRLIHGLTREAVDAYVRQHPDREPFFFVRTGALGRPGSPALESASWPGDNSADWGRASGIGSVVPDMLNRGILGSYGFVSEIGGFIDIAGPIDDELFTRWSQQAALMPVHRLHGHPVNGTQMPWDFGPEAYDAWLATADLHQRAQPLIRQLWAEGAATGAPIARPLWWHHPDHPEAREADQSWLLGPDVLVAPVVEEGATAREVWFPPGCWQPGDPAVGTERIEGPLSAVVDAPLSVLPWYVRCGTDPLGDAAVRRIAGGDRIETAVAVAGVMPGWTGERIVLARADDAPDALAGAPLAARERAPMLLTDPDVLSPQVEELILARGVRRAVLLGGTAALDPAVEARLVELGVEVERVAGADRIATAVAIADRVLDGAPAGGASQAYVATSADAADALSAAPLAAYRGAPVLLTAGDRLDPRVAEFLQRRAVGAVTLVGGEAALGGAVAADAVGAGAQVDRIAAADRYATSAAVARAAIAAGMAGDRPWIARGDDPADALAAGPVIAADAATLVLTAPDQLPGVVADHLADVLGAHPQVHLLGGGAAIAEAVESALDSLAVGS